MNSLPDKHRLKIMLTGKNGQVGWELQRTLAPLGEVTALGREELDLTDIQQIRERVKEIKPDIIVNAAAYTAVDRAEEEPELAMAVNGTAPGILAEEAKKINALIIHYSTDYVFDGTKNSPYTEKDIPKPVNVYGKTKLEGERAVQDTGANHFILRTSWVYGLRGKNFLLTILRLSREREELSIVDDQVGSPTWCRMIAEATGQILARLRSLAENNGIYHLNAGGQTSWCGFARLILNYYELNSILAKTKINPIPTSQYPTSARRPLYTVMSNNKLNQVFSITMPGWEESLKLVLENNK